MWGRRQQDDDWDGEHRDQSEGNRERRPDGRGGGYWDDSSDWAGNGTPANNGNRQGFGDADRQGFGDADRRGYGDSTWAEQQPPRRGRDSGFGDPGYSEPVFGDPGYSDRGFGDPGYSDRGFGDRGFAEPGLGAARHGDPRQGDPRQADSRQEDSRIGDGRRPMRDVPDGGFGHPGYGGRGGDFGGGDSRGRDRRDGDRRDADRRDGDRRDGQWGDAGDWGQPEPEKPMPMFTPTVQAPAGVPDPGPVGGPFGSSSGPGGSRPYGRLSIFTLLDDKTTEFDRLAEQAAEGVRMLEPDTLVFVMHVVPKAPLQRIIYEIYRDHAAFEKHQRQPHIQQFEEGRRASVLVTNIIDLRLKYAKVAPLQGATQASPGQPALGQAALGQPAPSQSALPAGPRHRAPKSPELDGNGWHGDQFGGRPGDLDADWAPERSFDGLDRRSQDQYTSQRYRDN
jgi:quinol monooxygenase YgiN